MYLAKVTIVGSPSSDNLSKLGYLQYMLQINSYTDRLSLPFPRRLERGGKLNYHSRADRPQWSSRRPSTVMVPEDSRKNLEVKELLVLTLGPRDWT